MIRKHVLATALTALSLVQEATPAPVAPQVSGTHAAQVRRFPPPVTGGPYSVEFVATAATGVDMNDAGDVIGTSYLDVGCGPFCLPPQETVVWRGKQRIVLPSVPGLAGITVRGINNQGWVVGSAGFNPHAVVWKPLGPPSSGYQAIDIGTLPGKTTSTAIGIDEQGRVVGWSATTSFPPSGAPFLWTEAGGLVDLSLQGFPLESPLAISPGGTVATQSSWYALDDPGSAVPMAAPPSGFWLGGGAVAINDAGDQGRFLIAVSGQNLAYLYRYHHEGTWQLLSPSGTGHLTTYGIGGINAAGDVTGTVLGTGVIAYGPDGLAQSLASLLTAAYPGSVVTAGGTLNASGEILSKVMIGRSARLVRMTPSPGCGVAQGPVLFGQQCLRVESLEIGANFIPDPNDPSQSQCAPTLNAHNEAQVTLAVADEAGFPLEGALVLGRFLDDYWTDERVFGTTGPDGSVSFSYTGLCGVGALAFLVDDVKLAGHALDKNTGVLTGWVIPQLP